MNCWRFRNWIYFISSSQPYNQFLKQSWELPFLKLTFLHLKMDAWKMIVSFWDGLFLGANLLLVSGRVGSGWLSSCWYGLNDYWSIKLTLTFWQLIQLPRWQLLLLVARVPNVGQYWYIHWFPKWRPKSSQKEDLKNHFINHFWGSNTPKGIRSWSCYVLQFRTCRTNEMVVYFVWRLAGSLGASPAGFSFR